jgi:hypothetical protein
VVFGRLGRVVDEARYSRQTGTGSTTKFSTMKATKCPPAPLAPFMRAPVKAASNTSRTKDLELLPRRIPAGDMGTDADVRSTGRSAELIISGGGTSTRRKSTTNS